MRELIGPCTTCGKLVFCENGFLNGQLNDKKSLLCISCFEKEDITQRKETNEPDCNLN